jgi:pyruvate dehydrogenase (quinone)
MQTTAQALVDRLRQWGVDTIFGFAGDGVEEILEVLRHDGGGMRFITVRHEEAAAFAACAYAKFTGRLGVCMATSGPGGVHLVNGLYDAKGDDAPVLAITGHTLDAPDRHALPAGCPARAALHGRRGLLGASGEP